MRRYVLGFLFSRDETRVALLRKTRPAWQAGRLNGVGGHAEEGETFDQAMAREAREELGDHHGARDDLGAGAALTWRRFATVESHRFEDTDKLLEERWIMACYRCQDDLAIAHLPRTNDMGEAFEPCYVSEIMSAWRENVMTNLPWLLAMALSRQERDWPFHVREGDER